MIVTYKRLWVRKIQNQVLYLTKMRLNEVYSVKKYKCVVCCEKYQCIIWFAVSDNELRRIREAFKRCAGANGSTLSLEAFVHEVLCDGVPYEVAEWLYQACGGTKRGISFKDLLCGVVVLTKGNIEEKIKWEYFCEIISTTFYQYFINKYLINYIIYLVKIYYLLLVYFQLYIQTINLKDLKSYLNYINILN